MLPKMLDYLLAHFFKEVDGLVHGEGEKEKEQKYQLMFEEIVRETAELVALWQCYGFCHGVLNTDNMSIKSLTIDYGPYAWMEHHDPDFICNHSDNDRGRYRYKAQPSICKWNLYKLSEALDPIVDIEPTSNYIRSNFDEVYSHKFYLTMAQKLGLVLTKAPSLDGKEGFGTQRVNVAPQEFREISESERRCIDKFMESMEQTGSDFTDSFRFLSQVSLAKGFEKALTNFVAICAPVKLLDKKDEPKQPPAQILKIKELLQKQPMLLPMLGIQIKDAEEMVA
mmetsp:Transcript_11215/g.18877  ORF Transcript_11215/g.18877 Transcript_11215/m.18877 type:complete len:282 (+) Transcript_11215:742-1587(+)